MGHFDRLQQKEEEALERRLETAESIAQMAAGDRDEALENFAHVEQEYARLQQAAKDLSRNYHLKGT